MSEWAEVEEPADKPPANLWDRLRTDPLRAPEHVALAAAEYHGPAALVWADRRRRLYKADPQTLAQMARRRHVNLASVEGAATGVGGFITVVPDLVGLAWIQSRLVFFVAAAFGFDPLDRMRPAELLVLNGLYDSPGEARAALDGMGVTVAESWVGGRLTRDEAITLKLAKMVGKSSGKKLAGRLIPGFAIAFNSVANRRDTNALAKRAIKFYGG
ncbi:EcsC family protein [Solirubrobacter ginsenosidimutans]|uniref:EcsC family protein n=1 Tax=Solirubrobacter ginsenosidimutans TaxID=490573 RepID=A0A9X3S389_9ACTN|nr:EcsC family protein [Solirubrobacter ginsenosidimutans]MDA0163217.1 EcsC family protein [Solirubrobacter ginsenosidimutans]